jgi:hypothetical protein
VAEGKVHDIELIHDIKRTLVKARDLAVEANGFTLFYLIEMAIMETGQMAKKRKPPSGRKHHLMILAE